MQPHHPGPGQAVCSALSGRPVSDLAFPQIPLDSGYLAGKPEDASSRPCGLSHSVASVGAHPVHAFVSSRAHVGTIPAETLCQRIVRMK